MNDLFKQFAKKWKLHELTVGTIYKLLCESNAKYGKVSGIIADMGILITARQLKYFYRKCRLTEKFGSKKEIGKTDYIRLVEKGS